MVRPILKGPFRLHAPVGVYSLKHQGGPFISATILTYLEPTIQIIH